jgi:hypothetical protein
LNQIKLLKETRTIQIRDDLPQLGRFSVSADGVCLLLLEALAFLGTGLVEI